ncbi:MAG: YbhB/YbcL family Raf kinase inhibitor-like protein [Candidatus Altiarchaeota archaeon]
MVPLLGALLLAGCIGGQGDDGPGPTDEAVAAGQDNPKEVEAMKLTSAAFEDGGTIPKKYTCDGADVNPPLRLEGQPPGTASVALIVDDPDAPAGDWVHWVLWDIDPRNPSIGEGSPMWGTEGRTSFGTTGYGGPCPPSGVHRYVFKAYALDRKLGLPKTAGKAELLKAMEGRILAKTQLIGKYGRS